MTPEELDEARAREAERRIPWREQSAVGVAQLAARLARENWRPVDPDLLEAREIAAQQAEMDGSPDWATRARQGEADKGNWVQIALAAIKRGRELERGGK